MLRTITTSVCLVAAAAAGAQTPAKAAQPIAKPAMVTAMKPAATAQASVKKPALKRETPAQLRKEAKVSMLQARATALKQVPNGHVQSSELERENGALIYSFDIKVPGKPGIEELNVNAMTGAVVAHEHETPKTEAKEKKAEKK